MIVLDCSWPSTVKCEVMGVTMDDAVDMDRLLNEFAWLPKRKMVGVVGALD